MWVILSLKTRSVNVAQRLKVKLRMKFRCSQKASEMQICLDKLIIIFMAM